MALIKCPECGKEISDRAPVCVHCGYPLTLLSGGNVEQRNEIKEKGNFEKKDGEQYSIKITNYYGSKVKVITVLKNVFHYSMDDAKVAVNKLPLVIETSESKTILRKVAQDFTDAGIEFEIVEGETKIEFDLKVTEKSKNDFRDSNSYKTKSIFKKCPMCGSVTNQEGVYYCPKCHVRYEQIADNTVIFQSVSNSQDKTYIIENTNVPKCPTCQSTNIKKISGLAKAGSVIIWGILSQKVKKQWHCDNCGYEW